MPGWGEFRESRERHSRYEIGDGCYEIGDDIVADNALLNAALFYARRGWPVFPLHTWHGQCSCGNPQCASPGKHPRIKRWQNEATTDEAQIRRWWTAWPDANIGLAAGKRAGWWVLDIDAGKGGNESLDELVAQHGSLPDTVESLTGGGGRHLLFAWPDGLEVRNTTKLADLPGLDVRGEGGYIVAPPSAHASGWEYAWELSSDPMEGVAIAEAPEWLLELVAPQASERESRPIPERDLRTLGDDVARAARALQQLSPTRADNYDDWVQVGMALCELGPAGLALWEQWSRQSTKFKPGECERKWRTFQPGDGLTLATLFHFAAQDSPPAARQDPPRSTAAGPARPPGPEPQEVPEPPEEPPAPAHLTDWGNAQRLVRLHGQDMRYCHLWGKWLIWDGRRWAVDTSGAAERLAKSCVAEMYAEASRCRDDDHRKALAKHALKSEGQRAISAMLALAQSEPGIPVQPVELDADPWLLNVLNGTIDLRTGELRPHRREDLLIKLAPVEYDAGARSEAWERFLSDATGGDAELQTFLQRAAGYSLTGETDEEKLFFVHGPAASGKSTFLEALKGAFGDYAETADFETFLARQYVGGPRNDVARLAGARLVVSIEVDEGKKLAEGLVKTLTGGDTVTARFMYREAFSFRPQMKLWLAANHAPKVKDDDEAMWRRILRVPFERVVPKEKRDPRVKATLRDPQQGGPAILAWAVRGCLAWQREGLGIPPAIEQATQAYRLDNDPLREFFASCCVFGPTKTVTIAALNEEYETWCNDNRERPIKAREFNRRLEARGCRRDRDSSGSKRIWIGIGLAYNKDPENEGSLTTLTASDNISSKALREADTSPTLPNLLSETVRTVRNNDRGDMPKHAANDDPTDRGVWEPPPDVQRMMQEVFGDAT